MPSSGDSYFNPVTSTTMRFVTTAADSGGRELVIDWDIAPGERLPKAAHQHGGPDGHIIETFEVIEGRAECRIGRETLQGDAGHVFRILCNTPHVHPRNIGAGRLIVRQRIAPAAPDMEVLQGVERFFETLAALGQQRRITRNGDIINPLQGAVTLADCLLPVTTIAGIPIPVQVAAFYALARVGRAMGYRAHLVPLLDR